MTETDTKVLGEIHITVTDTNVRYDSEEFSFPEVVFWLETLKAMMVTNVITGNNGVEDE